MVLALAFLLAATAGRGQPANPGVLEKVSFIKEVIEKAEARLDQGQDISEFFRQILATHVDIQAIEPRASKVQLLDEGDYENTIYCKAGQVPKFEGWNFDRYHSWWSRLWYNNGSHAGASNHPITQNSPYYGLGSEHCYHEVNTAVAGAP